MHTALNSNQQFLLCQDNWLQQFVGYYVMMILEAIQLIII